MPTMCAAVASASALLTRAGPACDVEHARPDVVSAGPVICSTIAVRQRRFWPIDKISASRS
jgi:hypothetical protein